MVGCPYCGEKINREARLCRHCNRTLLYSLVLDRVLSDKESHQFARQWQDFDKKNIRHISFSNYKQAKIEITKLPVTLAWDLSLHQVEELKKTFEIFSLDQRLQGGLPSSYNIEPRAEKSSYAISLFFATITALCLISSAWYLINNPSEEIPTTLNSQDASDISISVKSIETPQKQEAARNEFENSKDHIIDRNKMNELLNATVFIKEKNMVGSGFLVTDDGYIVSNAHVTSKMESPTVILRDGSTFTASKIKEDSRIDASVIKIPIRGADYLRMGDANKLYPGQTVITIGNPGGLSFTVTRGIVSYVGRLIGGVPYIQTDAAINRGNSGGPMINEEFEVVGINSMTSLGEQGISFALPINYLCGKDGLTEGVGTQPSKCDDFKSSTEGLSSANFERKQAEEKNSQPQISSYQKEVFDLKNVLDRKEKEIANESLRLINQIKSLQSELYSDSSNISLKERIEKQIDEKTKEYNYLPKKRIEAQLQYIKQVISVLERQKADPDYNSYSNQIVAQIETLKTQQKTLEISMGN